MKQVDPEDCVGEAAGAFVFRSRPNCSLTSAQEQLALWSLAAPCGAAAIAFALAGYWIILLYAGLQVGVLAWAFRALRERKDDYERLTIDGDRVVLEWRSRKREGRRELNRQWTRVRCTCAAPGRNCRVGVCCYGRETLVGQYLSDEARLRLAATLRSKLQA
ncbi:probable transmembrane protein [Thiobacillus denitrificans ATCC 25259]|uniref:Probable transmembrane protein n=1 Tax=Thiobacillus denitrificans (strain ATCC 25259 / T1) TaxID=292415 RepID=Q3SLX6_THIDA|nr:DUF2244 domain-containing protein [Thiobacillus denitrificans]AAZ96277.1 probable transmembrane protein [Thiobacillus denitrificans ATCC 25259]